MRAGVARPLAADPTGKPQNSVASSTATAKALRAARVLRTGRVYSTAAHAKHRDDQTGVVVLEVALVPEGADIRLKKSTGSDDKTSAGQQRQEEHREKKLEQVLDLLGGQHVRSHVPGRMKTVVQQSASDLRRECATNPESPGARAAKELDRRTNTVTRNHTDRQRRPSPAPSCGRAAAPRRCPEGPASSGTSSFTVRSRSTITRYGAPSAHGHEVQREQHQRHFEDCPDGSSPG